MSQSAKSQEIRLADYKVPAFLVEKTELDFDIQPAFAKVTSRVVYRRNPACPDQKAPLFLNGVAQKLVEVKVNGRLLTSGAYTLTDEALIIPAMPDKATVQIISTNEPKKNTTLFGLYAAGTMLSTQCEPHGFRRITYYPDRPDVMSKFTVTIHADKKQYPTMLSNGNLIAKGTEKGGRHWVKWQDPFRKPAYLFALVAGTLDRVEDSFRTKSGKKVLLQIYTDPGRKNETGIALASIKKAMKWDEDRFGLEYDLNRFMMVAVSRYNHGAMENKGLNTFNDAAVLGRSDTASDARIAFIERVVGHEYFHNWTGDRVTCRDWFQLSLKEGLTVFREQEFCGAMNSTSVERIETAQSIRNEQFAEDAGALSHPIRPQAYVAVDNFYTRTVYGKGSEVCRMIQTLVGKKGFEKGLSLYLKRNDGKAATCEDFVKAMEDANKIDLKHFSLWYNQSGTPEVTVKTAYNPSRKTYTLTLSQKTKPTADQSKKLPLHIPFAVGLIDEKGKDLIGTKVLSLHKAQEKFVFKNIRSKPVPSLLRAFSAPVRLNYSYTDAELLFLMSHDTDSFNRWDAGQKLLMKLVLKDVKKLPSAVVGAFRAILCDANMDAATKAASLMVPGESEIGLTIRAAGKPIDPLAVYHQRHNLICLLAQALEEELWATFVDLESTLDESRIDGEARGLRSLKNLCLAYLSNVAGPDVLPIAAAQVAGSENMSDQLNGLGILAKLGGPASKEMLRLFGKRYTKMPNILDSWFAIQASQRRPGILKEVKELMKHKVFTLKVPNRVSGLIGTFAGNPFGFHAADGSGYKFLADFTVAYDRLNPLSAARLGKAFLRWKDYDPKRQKLMKAQLKRMAKDKGLSPSLREIVTKSL